MNIFVTAALALLLALYSYGQGWDDGVARVCPLPVTELPADTRPTVPDAPAKRSPHLPTSRLGVA